MIRRVDVLSVLISAVTMDRALTEIERWIEHGERHYVCVTGVHGVMESQRDPELRRIHNASGMTTPDGMPLVWAGRIAGAEIARVYGPDLMLELCRRAEMRGWSSYFYGGRPGIPDQLIAGLRQRFPQLGVVGSYSPPFRPATVDEDERVVEAINSAAPDIVWVGLSTPKQERWMAGHVDRLTAPVLIGVGAAFDIHAGALAQAPLWMQRSGLEWLYRLSREPRRLWRRYLFNNPAFVYRIMRNPPKLAPARTAP